ncbi:hypothetical protein FE257_000257 [Aspergillus nanangensis]|uniref:Uncharacterized protein n=1 Tax=Aspergillus nanangensis TaxID=2582783 RepID=A0AAD4D0T2_ASPNN|nr:hypothetical protein FE257_000257 [Aspergillus nanangensis]
MDAAKKATVGSLPEDQKHRLYDNLPEEKKQQQTYSEWLSQVYNDQYQKWMPWIEDMYLRWFGRGDNKTSYATKDTLSKSKITGISQVDQLQDDVHNLVGNQLGDRGLLAPVGKLVSKEGINRAEREGKGEDGSYGGPLGGATDPVVNSVKGGAQSVSGGMKSVGGWFSKGQ